MPRSLGPGVYGPLPTFFDDDQQINYDDYRRHLLSKFWFCFKLHRPAADIDHRIDAASQGISAFLSVANDQRTGN